MDPTSTRHDLSLQEIDARIEELNKVEVFSEEQRRDFLLLAERRMEVLDEIFHERTGRWPIL